MESVSLEPKIHDASTVVSIVPVRIHEKKPGLIPGEFFIPAVKDPKKDIETLVVTRSTYPVYIDSDRPALIVPEPSDRVAASIVRDYKVGLGGFESNVAEPGLFWVPGALSKKQIENFCGEQLDLARRLQTEWFKRIVDAADDDWQKYRIRRMISGLQRIACTHLGLTKDWNQDKQIEDLLKLVQCKFCRADIHPEAIICSHCNGILNLARYEKEFVKAGTALK